MYGVLSFIFIPSFIISASLYGRFCRIVIFIRQSCRKVIRAIGNYIRFNKFQLYVIIDTLLYIIWDVK